VECQGEEEEGCNEASFRALSALSKQPLTSLATLMPKSLNKASVDAALPAAVPSRHTLLPASIASGSNSVNVCIPSTGTGSNSRFLML
jgi:hypothetical protein